MARKHTGEGRRSAARGTEPEAAAPPPGRAATYPAGVPGVRIPAGAAVRAAVTPGVDLQWRWNRATRAAAGRPDPDLDPDTIRAARFLAGAGDRAVAAAERLARAPELERAVVEAYVLAGEAVGVIGPKVGLDPAVVAAYEALFFDVRGRRPLAFWVAFHYHGPGFHPAVGPRDDASLLRWAGYRGGPEVVDLVRAAVTGVGRDRYAPEELAEAERLRAEARLLGARAPAYGSRPGPGGGAPRPGAWWARGTSGAAGPVWSKRMPWATRGAKRVFYLSERAGEAVRKTYFAAGPTAAAMAAAVAKRKAGRERLKALRAAELAKWRAVESVLDELDALLRTLVHARLTTSGFKQHKREWRRTRVRPDP